MKKVEAKTGGNKERMKERKKERKKNYQFFGMRGDCLPVRAAVTMGKKS